MSRICVGIDPGKSGGISIIWAGGTITSIPWSDDEYIEFMDVVAAKYVCEGTPIMCCVEKVGAMPGQGVTSMFSFGKSAGFIEGVLQAFRIPYQLIPPQKWKKEFGLNSSKQKSIDVCKKLFPNVSLRRTERCTTDHDGMAESLLMAEYARRKL